MNNNRTELVFVIDMSGSMVSLTEDTIGGFNSVLKKQREKEGEVLVTTYLFNNDSRMIHDRLPIAQVSPMTGADYCTTGCTALVDALGDAIRHIVQIHRYARPEDVPAHTVFMIITDGMENASHRYTAENIRGMIQHEKEKYGWEFVFLAANIDAVETAGVYGIGAERAVNYRHDGEGTKQAYQTMSNAISCVREAVDLCCPSWRKEADQDFQSRA